MPVSLAGPGLAAQFDELPITFYGYLSVEKLRVPKIFRFVMMSCQSAFSHRRSARRGSFWIAGARARLLASAGLSVSQRIAWHRDMLLVGHVFQLCSGFCCCAASPWLRHSASPVNTHYGFSNGPNGPESHVHTFSARYSRGGGAFSGPDSGRLYCTQQLAVTSFSLCASIYFYCE